MNEVWIKHAFSNPQPDDVGPDTYVKPKHWNAIEVLSGSAGDPTDGDVLTWNPSSASKAAYRSIVAGSGVSVSVLANTISIAVASSVITGAGTTNKIPKWTSSNTLGDSIMTEGAGLLDISGASASYSLRIIDNTNGARFRTIAGSVTGDLYNSGGGLFLMAITSHAVGFFTNNIERGRFAATGELLLGHTSTAVAPVDIRGGFAATTSASVRGIYYNGSITAISAASDLFGMDLQPQTVTKNSSGTHALYAVLNVRAPASFAGGASITDTALLHITGTPAGGTNNYAMLIDTGSVKITSAGPHVIGGALDTRFGVYFTGAFTPTGTVGSLVRFDGTLNPPVNSDGYGVTISPTINEAASGTHADLIGLRVIAPTINAGAASVTNATTVKIEGAPAAASASNYALWVAAGAVRFQAAGPHSFGGNPISTSNIQVEITGSFTAGTNQVEGLSIRSTLSPAGAFNAFGAVWSPTIAAGAFAVPLAVGLYAKMAGTVGAGSIASTYSLYLDPPTGAAATTSGALYISGPPSNGTSNYSIFVDAGNVRFDGKGSLGIDIVPQYQWAQGGSHNPAIAATTAAFVIATTVVGASSQINVGAWIQPTLTPSGTPSESQSLRVDPQAGTQTGVTTASTVAITGAPSGATNNYALHVTGGSVRFNSAGPHAIGAVLNTGIALLLSGSFASGQSFARGVQMDTTLTANADGGSLVGIYLNPALTERAGGTHGVLAGMYVLPTVVAGAATTTNFSGVYIDAIVAQSGTTNAAALTIGGAPTGATNNYGILAAGSIRFTDAGPHAIGGALDGTRQVSILGSFGAGTTNIEAVRIITTLNPGASNSAFGITLTPTFVEGTGGAHPDMTCLYIEPSITAGTSTLTNLYGINVNTLVAQSGTTNAYALRVCLPTGATNNYSLLAIGLARFDAAVWQAMTSPTYGANVAINLLLANTYRVVVTNGTAFQVDNPTNPPTNAGDRFIVMIKNTSGGAHGAITWAGQYKMGGALAAVATGFSKSVEFVYDGTNYIETYRSPADVAN